MEYDDVLLNQPVVFDNVCWFVVPTVLFTNLCT